MSGQTLAIYTPATVAELIAQAKPVSPIKTQIKEPEISSQVEAKEDAPAETSEAKTLAAEDVELPTPEISMEIKAAEYIPPRVAVKPVVSQAIGGFPYGQCTWYVASRRPVSWSGNAHQWYRNAQAAGYKVGKVPTAGSIMVTWESPIGHVAYVERVNADGSFTVSEMNYSGSWGKVTSRTIRGSDVPLIGFIY